jgi:replicative DNA helicase
VDRFDVRSEIVRALKARAEAKFTIRGTMGHFSCVRHDDANPSAWLGDNAWGCYGCTPKAESLRTLAELLGINVPTSRGFSVADYADRKKFTISHLERWGVKTVVGKFGDDVVAIPYRDSIGTLLRTKMRTASKTFWHDDGTGSHLYGLELLANSDATAAVILVEGESDCHAAWHHGVLTVGVPGAGIWKPAWAAHLTGHPVYIWQEPDKGGAQFIARVIKDIPEAMVISLDGVKDFAVLHANVGKEFKTTVMRCVAAARSAGSAPTVSSFSAIIGRTLDELQEQKLRPVDAVPTMLPSWNAACRGAGGGVGLARGWVHTIGANTGAGKSLIAGNLAAAAIEAGERVGFVTLEMSKDELATRLLSISSGVSASELEQGKSFSVISWQTATRHINAIHERTGGVVYVNDKRLRDLDDVVDAVRYLHEFNGVRYVILDYLQLVWIKGRREPDILERIQEVSAGVSAIAKDLGLVFVGLSQFNRQTSANRSDPPMPQGLMGGSPLENDSDQVILLDHSQYERNHEHNTATTRLLLSKNRHGPAAIIPVRWDYRSLRIREIAQGAVSTVPGFSTADGDRGEAWEPDTGSAA